MAKPSPSVIEPTPITSPHLKSDSDQFTSGLEQSFQALRGDQKQLPSSAVASSAPSRRWQIRYDELTFGAPKGKGAYGIVFEGEFRKETVAIKVYDFRGKLSEREQTEILREAELMEIIRSQYLVGFRGICLDPRYCLVMEYCEGGTLRARLSNSAQAISFPEQLRWAQQISYGLYQLHSVQIFHRDLKAENVLLDKHGEAKIADFGLSIVKNSSASQSKVGGGNGVAGTLPWMAPELFEGRAHEAKSDVYSLGMVLWEIVSRQTPFKNSIPAALVGMVLAGKRETLPEVCPDIFRTLIMGCWNADPKNRPTAETVGDQFAAALRSLDDIPMSILPKPTLPIAFPKQVDEGKAEAKFLDAKSLQGELGEACERGDIETAKSALSRGADVNGYYDSLLLNVIEAISRVPDHFPSKKLEFENIALLLIESGAQVHYVRKYDDNSVGNRPCFVQKPLIFYVIEHRCSAPIITALVRKNAHLDKQIRKGCTEKEFLCFFLSSFCCIGLPVWPVICCNADQCIVRQQTPLEFAISIGNLEAARILQTPSLPQPMTLMPPPRSSSSQPASIQIASIEVRPQQLS